MFIVELEQVIFGSLCVNNWLNHDVSEIRHAHW